MLSRSAVRSGMLAGLLACVAMWALPAIAAAEQTLQVSPTKTMLDAKAGDEQVANITITAPEAGIRVSYSHFDFGFGKDYQVNLIRDSDPKTTAFSTRGWFTVKQPEFTIKARQSRIVPVQIKVPKNTPSGTYLGVAMLTISPSDKAAGQIQTNVSIASLIFISVAGGDPPKAKIRRFDVPRLVTPGSFTPDLVVDNVGSLGFNVDGDLRVNKQDPTPKTTFPQQYVQPDMPRTLHITGSKKGTARVDTSKLGIGKHELTLRLRIDPTNSTLVVKRTFWVIPMWLRILAGLLVIALIVGVSWLVAVMRRRRGVAREARLDENSDGVAVVESPDEDTPVVVESEPDDADFEDEPDTSDFEDEASYEVDDEDDESYDEPSYEGEFSAEASEEEDPYDPDEPLDEEPDTRD